MRTNFDNLIPLGVLFPLRQIQDLKIIKVSTMKKLIEDGEIEVTMIGVKYHIPRDELIRYLELNTICVDKISKKAAEYESENKQ